MLGDLEKSCSAIWRNRVRQFWRNCVRGFGEIMFGDLEKPCSVILEKSCSAQLRRLRIGVHHEVA